MGGESRVNHDIGAKDRTRRGGRRDAAIAELADRQHGVVAHPAAGARGSGAGRSSTFRAGAAASDPSGRVRVGRRRVSRGVVAGGRLGLRSGRGAQPPLRGRPVGDAGGAPRRRSKSACPDGSPRATASAPTKRTSAPTSAPSTPASRSPPWLARCWTSPPSSTTRAETGARARQRHCGSPTRPPWLPSSRATAAARGVAMLKAALRAQLRPSITEERARAPLPGLRGQAGLPRPLTNVWLSSQRDGSRSTASGPSSGSSSSWTAAPTTGPSGLRARPQARPAAQWRAVAGDPGHRSGDAARRGCVAR